METITVKPGILRNNTPETQAALEYFGLSNHSTVEDLEAAKFKMNTLNPIKDLEADKFKMSTLNPFKDLATLKNYNTALDFLMYSDKDFDSYKAKYMQAFKQKFYQVPKKFEGADALNLAIMDVIDTLSTYESGLSKEESEEDFKIGVQLFYKEYQAKAEKVVHEFLKYLNKQNAVDLTLVNKEVEKNIKGSLVDKSIYSTVNSCKKQVQSNTENKNKLRRVFRNKYLYQLDCYFKNKDYEEMLAPYYDDIDAFITKLSSKINAMIRPLIILNEADIEKNYEMICDEIEDVVENYGDRIEDTISKDVTKMIKKVANDDIKSQLVAKLHFADSLESYREIYNIAAKNQGNNLQSR